MTFRFRPPAPEEARAFAAQFLGSLAAVVLLAVLFWRAPQLRPVLVGAGLGLALVVARSAWALELKARRAQAGGIEVDEEGVRVSDGRREQSLRWADIERCEARGGKLHLSGAAGELELSAREVEEGTQLIEEIASRWRNGGKRGFVAPTDFIPLSPR